MHFLLALLISAVPTAGAQDLPGYFVEEETPIPEEEATEDLLPDLEDLPLPEAEPEAPLPDPAENAAPEETEFPVEIIDLTEPEDPAEAAAPVETEAPEETAVPEETAAPAETEAPAEAAAPEETAAPAETEAPAETAAPSDGLPDWVQRDTTGAFAVQAPNILSIAATEQTAPLAELPQPVPPGTDKPRRVTGHGDARRAPGATIRASQWPPATSPVGDTRSDLTEAFLSAMATSRPLASRQLAMPRGDDSDLGDRAAFERTLEKRIDTLLNAMLGPGLAHAFVRAAVETIPGSGFVEMKEKSEQAAVLWDDIQDRIDETPPVLPGYPLPHTLKAEVLARVAAAAAPIRNPDRSRTILTVSLLVDESVDEAALTPVTAAVADAIGLDPARGDVLLVTRADIRPTWRRLIRTDDFRGKAVIALCVVLGAGIPLCLALFFGRPMSLGRILNPKRKSAPRLAQDMRDVDLHAAPFWNDARYAEAVGEFLAKEPPAAAATLLGLLSHDAAGSVFRKLPEGHRRRIVTLLASGKKVDSKELFTTGQLRKRLREHLAGYARGPGLLEELLLRAPEDVREGLIGDIRRTEPRRAARLARSIPSMRELAKADAPALRLCLSTFSTLDLVCAFYDFHEGSREKMLEALPLLLRESIRDELKTFVPESMETVESARAMIMARWRRLELDGRVTSFLSASADSI